MSIISWLRLYCQFRAQSLSLGIVMNGKTTAVSTKCLWWLGWYEKVALIFFRQTTNIYILFITMINISITFFLLMNLFDVPLHLLKIIILVWRTWRNVQVACYYIRTQSHPSDPLYFLLALTISFISQFISFILTFHCSHLSERDIPLMYHQTFVSCLVDVGCSY